MNWSKEEIEYLKKVYSSKISLKEILQKLNRTKRSVHHKAVRLCLSRLNIPANKPRNKNHRNIIDKRYYEKHKKEIYNRKKERIRAHKLSLLKIFGCRCSICGYNRCIAALEFHHKADDKDRSLKESLQHFSKQKAFKEAKKCIILCSNCHREVHHKDRVI